MQSAALYARDEAPPHHLVASRSLPNKLVAESAHRNDMLGVRRLLLKLLSQPCDVHIERARTQSRIVVPNGFQKSISGSYNTSVLYQVPKVAEILAL